VSYIVFAYLFQENFHPLESKIVTVLFLLAALYSYISNFGRYPFLKKTYDFSAHYFTYVFGPRVSIVTGLGYFWIIVVFLRKTVLSSEYSGSLETWLQKPSSFRYLIGSFFIALVKIIRPRGKNAKSLQAFALLTMGMFAISFLYFLMSTEVISRQTYGFFFNTGGLLTTFAIFIVYTNYTFEPSSFRWKLVGVSLAPIMVIMGIVGSIILSFADTSFDNQRKLEVENIKSLLIVQKDSDLPIHVVYIVSRPNEGGLSADTYTLEKSREPELQAEDFIASDMMIRDNDVSKAGSVLMKKNKKFEFEKALVMAHNEIDLQLERRFRYFNLYDTDSFYIHYDFNYGNRLYEIGYSYKWYREEIHKIAIKLFFIILGTTIIIIILFPVFFYRSLFTIDLRIF
jgi:hypothetical protein